MCVSEQEILTCRCCRYYNLEQKSVLGHLCERPNFEFRSELSMWKGSGTRICQGCDCLFDLNKVNRRRLSKDKYIIQYTNLDSLNYILYVMYKPLKKDIDINKKIKVFVSNDVTNVRQELKLGDYVFIEFHGDSKSHKKVNFKIMSNQEFTSKFQKYLGEVN